jgi:N-acetyl sugar amidotransferase
MDDTDPNIIFDQNGVCDQCLNYLSKVKVFTETAKNKDAFRKISKEIILRKGKNEFDSIIGLSGGLDSSYMLHKVVKDYSMKPLVVHVDAGWNTEEAVSNINNLVKGLNLDLYTEVINWKEMRNLQIAFFKSGVAHLDIPQDHAFISSIYHFAKDYKIKTILNGGNFATEGIRNPLSWLYYGSDIKQILDINDKFGSMALKDYPLTNILWHKVYLKYVKNINVIKPLNYFNYNKKHTEHLLSDLYGWKGYPQKHFESRFTRFFEGYWLPNRFGYDTRKPQLSSLILSNQITRDEALDILKLPPIDKKQEKEDLEYVARKLQISETELDLYFKLPLKYYHDYKNQSYLFNLGSSFMKFLGLEKSVKR